MHPKGSDLGPGSARLWVDESLAATLFVRDGYVARREAWALHRGEATHDGNAHFLLPLQRALARIAPGAFDAPPRSPWQWTDRRGSVVRLRVCPGHQVIVEAVVEAAGQLGLAVYDGASGELTQPMRLDRADVLAQAIADLGERDYVILEGGPGCALYVQAFGEGPGVVRIEAVSARYLPASLARTRPRTEALAALDFSPPMADLPNHFRRLPRANEDQRIRAAEIMLEALRDAYGVSSSETYQLRCSPF